MNAQKVRFLIIGCFILVWLVGCTPVDNEVEPAIVPTQTQSAEEVLLVETAVPIPTNTSQPPPSPTATPPTPKGETMPLNPPIPTPSNPTAQEWIRQAIEDLAQHLDIEPAQIELINYQTATWRDSSLGCPQPDMSYLQVLTEGYHIQLQANKNQFDYRGADGRPPFLCLNPSKTAPSPGLDDT